MHFFGNRANRGSWPLRSFKRKLEGRQQKDGNQSLPEKDYTALKERIDMAGKIRAYRRFFRRRVGSAKVFGEITPAYCMLDVEELTFIRTQFKSIKIIFLMRNPADRLWSQMRFTEKFETQQDLERLLDRVFQQQVYIDRIDYRLTITNLLAVFDRSQIHFEFYEKLYSEAAVRRLCDFLDVTYQSADFAVKHNVSPKMPLGRAARARIVEHLLPQYNFVQQEFPDDMPEQWRDDLI